MRDAVTEGPVDFVDFDEVDEDVFTPQSHSRVQAVCNAPSPTIDSRPGRDSLLAVAHNNLGNVFRELANASDNAGERVS